MLETEVFVCRLNLDFDAAVISILRVQNLRLIIKHQYKPLRMKSGKEGKNYPVLELENTLP